MKAMNIFFCIWRYTLTLLTFTHIYVGIYGIYIYTSNVNTLYNHNHIYTENSLILLSFHSNHARRGRRHAGSMCRASHSRHIIMNTQSFSFSALRAPSDECACMYMNVFYSMYKKKYIYRVYVYLIDSRARPPNFAN